MGKPEASPARTGKRSATTASNVGTVEVLRSPDSAASIARLFHRGDSKSIEAGTALLVEAMAHLGPENMLIAAAGFIRVELSEPTAWRLPEQSEYPMIRSAAIQAVRLVASRLPVDRPTVVFGVDVYATCYRSELEKQVGQFVVVVGNAGEEVLAFPKRFPTSNEDGYLFVPNDLPSPFLVTSLGQAAILVCHDVNVYSPRGEATTVYETREKRRSELVRVIDQAHPSVGLHLAHFVGREDSFRSAYNEWARENGVPLIGVAALPNDVDNDWALDLTSSLLSDADNIPIMDLLETHE